MNIPLTLTSSARDFEATETVVSNPIKVPRTLLLLKFITDGNGDCGDESIAMVVEPFLLHNLA